MAHPGAARRRDYPGADNHHRRRWFCGDGLHALFENGVFGVFVNRCGTEEWKHFFGGSLIVGPRGQILAQTGGEDAVITATLDLDSIENVPAAALFTRPSPRSLSNRCTNRLSISL